MATTLDLTNSHFDRNCRNFS
uniref:Uncharacterized protein n=1 Tax=Arundo donax TaxID=35708 RepID=A0A0A8ZX92_ARUDO